MLFEREAVGAAFFKSCLTFWLDRLQIRLQVASLHARFDSETRDNLDYSDLQEAGSPTLVVPGLSAKHQESNRKNIPARVAECVSAE